MQRVRRAEIRHCPQDDTLFWQVIPMAFRKYLSPVVISLLFSTTLVAQSATAPQKDSAIFDPDGTAHITRVVPMPKTISPEAQAWLESLTHNPSAPETLAERRARTDEWRAKNSAEARKLYPVTVE